MPDRAPIDVPRARKLICDLAKVLDSVGFTAPEIMDVRRERAARILDQLADAFGIEGSAEERRS